MENLSRKDTKETEKEKQFRENDSTNFLVALGSLASHSQIGKYTKEHVVPETKEKIISKNGIQILGSQICVVTGNEVEYSTNSSFIWKNICSYLSNRSNLNYGIEIESNTTMENSIVNHLVNPLKYSIGIEEDVEKVIKGFSSLPDDKDIVLFGVSRGTASIVHSLSTIVSHKNFSNVKGIILEGCIDSFNNIFNLRFQYLSNVMSFETAASIIQKVTGYDQTKNDPLRNILKLIDSDHKIPPLLIISSKLDGEVPFECSKNFYLTLKEIGLDIEFVELERSNHPTYMYDDEEDREKYYKAVHSFYKRINIPFIEFDEK
eukprot:gene12627-6531_t